MKKAFLYFHLTLFICIVARQAVAQTYGNEWINSNQQYYKIKTAKNGIYRLTYNDLVSGGFPAGSVDPRRIQLFHRGIEQAINVTGQLDASFDPADYIEFYGTRNDGTTDTRIYLSPEAQPHTYYNLFSDTSAFFLTWRLDNINGKRISTFSENNVNGLPAETYFLDERLFLYTSDYSPGLQYPVGQHNSETYSASYDYGEGWSGSVIRKGESSDFVPDSLGPLVTTGPAPEIKILLSGRNNLPHRTEILAGPSVSSLRSLGTVNFKYDSNYLFAGTLNFSDFNVNGKLTIRVKALGVDAINPDMISVCYIRIIYPHIPDLNNSINTEINLDVNPGDKSYINISNTGSPGKLWEISDPDQVQNIGFNISGSGINAIIPGTSQGSRLLIWGNNYIHPEIENIKFRNFEPKKPNYLIISHKKLMQPTSQYTDPVRAYAMYRASAQGGGYDTLVIEINELYNQFSYGEISPLAIRNFCNYILDNGDPKYLLLIGKSIYLYFGFYRSPAGSLPFDDLVPTFGFPGSDILFTSNKKGTTYEAAIPTGRIPAKTPEEVAAYLNKIKEADVRQYDALWHKDLIHLSGGTTTAELQTFRTFLNDLKAVAEDKYLGGKVVTINKQTNNVVDLINISDEVNKGKLLITFFGHSAPGVIDIDIGNASDPAMGYNNKGKYPVIYVNGCNAGEIFINYLSFSEDWIVTPDKGAIGFIAHSGVGYTTELKRFSDKFYATAFADSTFIHKSLGEIEKESGRRYLVSNLNPDLSYGNINIAQVQENVLQGDPAVQLFGAAKPDYEINNDAVGIGTISGQPVTSQSDSFEISVIVKNFGIVDDSSFYVSLTRTLPDGSKINYNPELFAPVFYMDTIRFNVDNTGIDAFGINQFDITIDPLNRVDELSKINNTAHFQYFLTKTGTLNLIPFPYAIEASDTVKLITQSTNQLLGDRNFMFQIDTVLHFNSPALKQNSVNSRVISEWRVPLFSDFPKKDSTVFYWRSRFTDIQPGEDNTWSESSFISISNSPEGWAQARPDQIKQDGITGMEYDNLSGQWKFNNNQTRIQLKTFGPDNPDYNFENVTLLINGITYIYNTRLCDDNSVDLLAFDYASTTPYLVLRFGAYDILDRRTCGRQPQVINNFLNNEVTGSQDYLTQYIDAVKSGDYILLFSIGRVTFQSWSTSLKTKVTELGISIPDLDALTDGEPVIILGRKGSPPGTAIIVKADAALPIPAGQQEINMDHNITGSYTSATIETDIIGPAKAWDNFAFKLGYINSPDESASFDIYSINKQGQESLYLSDQTSAANLSSLNALVYPFLKLKFRTKNDVSFTPAQLKDWVVTYEGLPEGILLPATNLQIAGIEKQEGENFESGFIFRNLTDKNFTDSIHVNYKIVNQVLHKNVEYNILISPLAGGASVNFTVPIHTLGFGGINDLTVFANPKIIPERYYNNNIIYLPGHFNVNVDRANPLIDVTIDGRLILDGEIVSPDPVINIRIKDENKLLFKKDTAGISILIKPPCESCQFKNVNLGGNEVKWTPATPQQDFNIDYRPKNLVDGIYTLQVQAADATGNPAGTQPYIIRFEVINESKISNFYPYPNPFSSSVRFIFTLTGGEIPDQIKIQVMTISGRVVREITQDEIGPVHIGNNMTEYAWNGHDEFGDQLANGVYLYRVIVRMNGRELPLRETAGDKAFTQGFGKIYLLR